MIDYDRDHRTVFRGTSENQKGNRPTADLRSAPPERYWLAFSGGKDSQAIYHLAELAGVDFDAHYQITSVDPPELVRFIKKNYKNRHSHPVSMDTPRYNDGSPITMWNLIPRNNMPPTRLARYCCRRLKESDGKGSVMLTGVRWSESARRKNKQGLATIKTQSKKLLAESEKNDSAFANNYGIIMNEDNDEARRMVEQCFRTNKTIVNPIIDWTDEDVWYFLNDVVCVEHCKLYDPEYGYRRLGCIGCPMNTHRAEELEKYPKYKNLYLRAFEKMLNNYPECTWKTPQEVYEWWLST